MAKKKISRTLASAVAYDRLFYKALYAGNGQAAQRYHDKAIRLRKQYDREQERKAAEAAWRESRSGGQA
jgi:hypothetical protein